MDEFQDWALLRLSSNVSIEAILVFRRRAGYIQECTEFRNINISYNI